MTARKTTALLSVALTFALLAAAPAIASEPIDTFAVTSSSAQAGGHPDLGMSFTLTSPGEPEAAKDVAVNTPEGVFGNPNAISRCTSADFALDRCPSDSQAGLITIRANYAGNKNNLLGTAPIFDLQPGADQTALFAFVVPTLKIPISIPVAVRTGGDYGLRFTVAGLTQLAPLAGADLTFWGFPAADVHDAQRFAKGSPGNPPGCPGVANTSCITAPTAASIAVAPLIDSPSVCTAQPLPATLALTTYQDPANPTTAGADYPAVTGCYNMTFKPFLLAAPTTSEADAPSGLDLRMSAPQPLGFATTPSPIHSAVLTLPAGFTINPDAADGQSSCSDAQAGFGSEAPSSCPDNAKIGTFSIGSPALDGRLEGSIFIGAPKPNDQYRLFLIADGFGIHAKLLGSVVPDSQTGRVTALIEDLPQVPFDDFALHLFSSDRGLMATPTRCNVYEVAADFFPWNTALPDLVSKQFFSLESGPNGTQCPGAIRPFHPRLTAGTSNPTAGAFSDFTLKLDRDDGDQFLGDLGFTMPPGFSGDLGGIDYCPSASIEHASQNPGLTERAIPSCPASSQIGTTNVAAGPGEHPFHAVGRMYLAGPFNGAPLSLAAITPALAGPFDYGTVVVRVALHVDTLTAQVKAVSDTVPQIIGGIPIRMRSIQVNIDKPNFTINPTNCAPMSVDSQGIGDQGTAVGFSSYFHVVNCAALPFKPQMTMTRVRGGTGRSADPSLRIDLDTRAGDANLKSLAVTLSNAFQLDQRHLGNICSEDELVAEQCAGRFQIGTATTTTPLLDSPLTGPVYAVSGSGGLPRLAFILGGQVTLIPRADAKTVKGSRLQTTVPVIPDAPIGHFSLTLFGGKQGYLVNTRSLCASKVLSSVSYVAQNGRTLKQRMPLKARCGKARKGAKQKRHYVHHHRG